MLLIRLFSVGLLLAGVLRAETPALLQAAVDHYVADAERWAFTQTSVSRDTKGKIKDQRVTRFDPSQPFEEQWTPIMLEGKPATERQIEQYRKKQEKRRKERPSFGEILAFEEAKVIGEDAQFTTFELPILKTGNKRLPPEKFIVTAKVSRESQSFDTISVRVRESWRMALVAKVKSGEIDLKFATVDPNYTPTITALTGSASASVMFVQVGGDYDLSRTEFKRVTPYSERFKVKIAPLKFLDF